MKKIIWIIYAAFIPWACFGILTSHEYDSDELFQNFKIINVSVDPQNKVSIVNYVIMDGKEPMIIGYSEIPFRIYKNQTYDETLVHAFRDALNCMNSREEIKPCQVTK